MAKFLSFNGNTLLTSEIGLIFLFGVFFSLAAGLCFFRPHWFASTFLLLVLTASLFLLLFDQSDHTSIEYYNHKTLFFLALLAVLGLIALYFTPQRILQAPLILTIAVLMFELTTTKTWVIFPVCIAFLITRRHFLPILTLFATTIFLTTPINDWVERQFALPEKAAFSPETTQGSKPFILHVILDEHLGIDGFDAFAGDAALVKADLTKFYSDRKFKIFTGAYSRHYRTGNSIPEIFRYGVKAPYIDAQNTRPTVARHPYLTDLQLRGHAVSLLQSNWLPFCSRGEVASCVTYLANGPSAVSEFDMPALEKAKYILSAFIMLSPTLTKLSRQYDKILSAMRHTGLDLPQIHATRRALNQTLRGALVLDQIARDMEHANFGQAYVAHAIFPHQPYAFDQSCAVKPFLDWLYGDAWVTNTPIGQRHQSYADQVRCSLKKMDRIFDAVENSPVGQNYIAIVHSDHGSRITHVEPETQNLGHFSDSDLIAGFSTFFAVRFPDQKAELVAGHIPVDMLLKNIVENDFRFISTDVPETPQEIILNDANWRPELRHTLPGVWPTETVLP